MIVINTFTKYVLMWTNLEKKHPVTLKTQIANR